MTLATAAPQAPQVRPHDVLVIGAGGAGLRAAIEAKAAGADVGLVCKSLLGKAHTVMAEGGVAAALGHVATADSWQIHFRDTMVGGKLLNNPRMAELHATEAPDRVRELELWGAVFDRTRRRADPPATVRRSLAPAPGPRRRPDRARDDPDAPGPGGLDGHHGLHGVHDLAADHGPHAGSAAPSAIGGRPASRSCSRPRSVVLATGGIGRAYEVTSNSWEYSGDGQALAYEAGAELIDMEFVQFHPTGMVWPPGVRGLLVTEAVRGEGGILRNKDGERFMWTYLPEDRRAEYAATDEEAARWVTALSEGRETDARRPPELSTRDNVARAIYTEVQRGARQSARRRLPRHQLPAARDGPAQAALDVRAVQGARRRRHHEGPDGGRPDHALRDGRHPRRRGDRARRPWPGCTPRARSPAGCTAPTGSAATRCRTCWCSGHGPARPRPPMRPTVPAGVSRPGPGPHGDDATSRRRSSGPTARIRTRSAATSRR